MVHFPSDLDRYIANRAARDAEFAVLTRQRQYRTLAALVQALISKRRIEAIDEILRLSVEYGLPM